jgi:plastocyanin
MDSFDSRFLTFVDSYGQRFMREGLYRYDAVPAGCGPLGGGWPYAVEVASGGDEKMVQHTVMLTYEERQFRPDQQQLRIKVGDLVTWACRDRRAPAFEVIGEEDFFSSTRLLNESGYAHAFGTVGEFPWVDAQGSRLRGVVRVRAPECRTKSDFARWRESLAKGQLVMITGEDADPAEVHIVTGQTVYFAVTKGPGISITDRRIAEATAAGRPPTHREASESTDEAAD